MAGPLAALMGKRARHRRARVNAALLLVVLITTAAGLLAAGPAPREIIAAVGALAAIALATLKRPGAW
jgi:hypothetical protein